MKERAVLWFILIISVSHGIGYYADTGHIDIMSLVFGVIASMGLTAKE